MEGVITIIMHNEPAITFTLRLKSVFFHPDSFRIVKPMGQT